MSLLSVFLVVIWEIITVSVYFLYIDAQKEFEKKKYEEKLKKRRRNKYGSKGACGRRWRCF